MYIHPFVLGAIATILAEVVVLTIYGIVLARGKK